jgi:hypothetical protein
MIDVEAIRARLAAYEEARQGTHILIHLGRWSGKRIIFEFIGRAPQDVEDLLTEVDRLNGEVIRMQQDQAAAQAFNTRRRPERLHIDTEPRRRKTVENLAMVGPKRIEQTIARGGCVAVNLKGVAALIDEGNVALGRLRPTDLADMKTKPDIHTQTFGSMTTYSTAHIIHDPYFCKI